MPIRSGLVSVDGQDLKGGAPTEKDMEGEQIHMLYSDAI